MSFPAIWPTRGGGSRTRVSLFHKARLVYDAARTDIAALSCFPRLPLLATIHPATARMCDSVFLLLLGSWPSPGQLCSPAPTPSPPAALTTCSPRCTTLGVRWRPQPTRSPTPASWSPGSNSPYGNFDIHFDIHFGTIKFPFLRFSKALYHPPRCTTPTAL